MANSKESNQDQLSLPGPSTSTSRDNNSTDDPIGNLENQIPKLTISSEKYKYKSKPAERNIETYPMRRINGCYVNVNTDFGEKFTGYRVKEWQCVYCLFFNTKREDFCNMCCNWKLSIDNVDRDTAISLRLDNNDLVDKHYDYIVDYCHSMKKGYIDDQFQPRSISLYYEPDNTKNYPVKWQRIRNTLGNRNEGDLHWSVFNNPQPKDVLQDNLEDCWFLSALAAVASRSELLHNIFVRNVYSTEGVYKIRLFINGKWTKILLDDYFPCDNDGRLLYAKGPGKQMWVILIQKAAAKVFGCYESLTRGWPSEGFILLTGQPCETLLLYSEYIDDHDFVIDFDMIWDQLISAKDNGFLMAITCGGNVTLDQKEYEDLGLHKDHSYSILDVRKINDECLIHLCDPLTVVEWKGDWSYQSDKWTMELKKQLLPTPPEEGSFWMSYKDIVNYFFAIDICKIRDWKVESVEGLLLPFTNANSLSYYSLTINSQSTEVHFTLFQDNQRYKEVKNRNLLDLCIVIFQKNGSELELIYHSKRRIQSIVNCEKILDPGEYIVLPLAFNHFDESQNLESYPRFVLNIRNLEGLTVKHVDTSEYVLADIIITMAITLGIKYEICDNLKLYVFVKDWSGAVVLIENRDETKWVEFHCNAENSMNVTTTRNSLETLDSTPPLTYKVINILTRSKYTDPFQIVFSYEYRFIDDPSSFPHTVRYTKINCRVIGLHSPRPIKI